ncbi:MAG: DUF4279 domain-containing protein [Gemmataceae bacterium]|nr:DUF4279 domain-containing protein [Gemmataceae bacterium]
MANEFHYCISLSIVHPTIDPKVITEAIRELHPSIKSRAGDLRRVKGKPVMPERKTLLSHWSADLHEEERIYSGSKPISEFILECLEKLRSHRDLFGDLRKEGEVSLRVGWFSEDNYSAEVLKAETLRLCGELGVDLELNFYGPSS